MFNPGVSLAESNRVGTIAEQLVLEVPEVKSVGRRTGRAELDEHAEGVHVTELEIDLKPSARPKTEIVADIRSRLSVLPLSINVGQPISHRLDHMLSGVRAEIALKIFGDDLDALRSKAEELRARLAGIPGLADLQVEKQVRIPQLEIRVDYRARRALRRAAGGGDRAAEPAVERPRGLARDRRLSPLRRGDAAAGQLRTTQGLGDLLIETPSGWIPARQIAEIKETDGPEPDPARERPPPSRRARPTATARADMRRIVDAHPRACCSDTQLPEGTFVSLEGTFQAQEQASAHHRPAVAGVAAR